MKLLGELMFLVPAKIVTRIVALVGKEWGELARQPGALITLVFAPFAVMALFGIGYSGERRPLNTVFVVPRDVPIAADIATLREMSGSAINVSEITDAIEDARSRLQRLEIDLLVMIPGDAEERIRSGEQAVIRVEYNRVDPVLDSYVRIIAERQVQEVNRLIIQRTVHEGQQYLISRAGATSLTTIPPEVLASPTRVELINWTPVRPTVIGYFAPAVLALVLQHMAITLTALSLVRDRIHGAIDLFRVAPVHPVEILVGKYVAYSGVCVAVAAILLGLTVFGLGVPLLGDLGTLSTVLGLLIFASVGLGMLISTISDSERQAVQLTMLVLLASVFFSGFVLPLEEFQESARWVAYVLPVTHGIRLAQDTMLRGAIIAVWHLWALAALGGALFLVTTATLHRALAREAS